MRPTLGAWLSQGDESRFTKQTGRKHDAEGRIARSERGSVLERGAVGSARGLGPPLGDEIQAREALEGIIQQALSGRALQAISEEALASYLSKLYVGSRAGYTRVYEEI